MSCIYPPFKFTLFHFTFFQMCRRRVLFSNTGSTLHSTVLTRNQVRIQTVQNKDTGPVCMGFCEGSTKGREKEE